MISNDSASITGSISTRHRVIVLVCATVLAVVSLWVVGSVIHCMALRIAYPFELSWMEGSFVDQARRVASGKPIYPAPSAEFIGMIYTPLNHFASAALIRIGFDGFVAVRLVSILGLSCAVLLGMWLTVRASHHRWTCVMVPVLALAGYLDVDAYMDVGRPDNLLAFCCTAAVGTLSLRSTKTAVPLFVACAVATLFVKQSSFVFLVLLLAGVFLYRRRLAILCAAASVSVAAVVFLIVNQVTQGWFRIYTMELPAHHRLDHAQLMKSLGDEFLGNFGILTAAVLTCLAALVLRPRRAAYEDDRRERTFIVLLVGTIAAGAYSAVSRWNIGGAGNVLIPYVILGAFFFPAAISRLIHQARNGRYQELSWPLGLVLLTVAAGGGLGPMQKHLPGPQDREEWSRLRRVAASVVSHAVCILSRTARARRTFSRMSSAFAVHVNDFGFSLCFWM